jgi:hypothetical protein
VELRRDGHVRQVRGVARRARAGTHKGPGVMHCYQLYLELREGDPPIMVVFDGKDDGHAQTVAQSKVREFPNAIGIEVVRGEERIFATGSLQERRASRVRHFAGVMAGPLF